MKDKETLTAKAIQLANIISYQEGAIVSRTLIDKEAGTLTLFAFDKGQGLSEHTAPYDALIQVFEGEAIVRISGKETSIKQGEIIIIPANHPHALSAMTRFKMLLTMIRS